LREGRLFALGDLWLLNIFDSGSNGIDELLYKPFLLNLESDSESVFCSLMISS
jgi:hypothetical protein